jgi:hypothetical protein
MQAAVYVKSDEIAMHFYRIYANNSKFDLWGN